MVTEHTSVKAATEYVEAVLDRSIAMLDARFFKGYARAHPEVVGRLVQAHTEYLRAMAPLGEGAVQPERG